MTHTLIQHNKAQFHLIELMKRNELHLLKEYAIIDEQDPDVIAAIEDRVCDLIKEGGEGERMNKLVEA